MQRYRSRNAYVNCIDFTYVREIQCSFCNMIYKLRFLLHDSNH